MKSKSPPNKPKNPSDRAALRELDPGELNLISGGDGSASPPPPPPTPPPSPPGKHVANIKWQE